MRLLAVVAAVCISCAGLRAEVVVETVTVDDVRNAPDERYRTPGFGGVEYVYYIGKYEVTNAQYCALLNAVAADDSNGLYRTSMSELYGGIERAGRRGSFTYSLIEGRGDWPVNFVDWTDAMRFANWLHNGQPTGEQNPSTTEDGSYDMSLGLDAVRKPGATVFLPTEDEWYKAAYYKGGGTDAGYWDYATQSDTAPSLEGPPGTDFVDGSANYRWAVGNLTDVGAYTARPSDSAYGTFDQGGNLWEWNEAVIGASRGLRGGSFSAIGDDDLHASSRYDNISSGYDYTFGFRVAMFTKCEGGFDGDADGDVDLHDVALFQLAFTGPLVVPFDTDRDAGGAFELRGTQNDRNETGSTWTGITEGVGPACGFDRNGDGDVDLDDFAPFQEFSTGP